MSTPTPHINAKAGDFAKAVLMPGDPLRAKFIAENFLEDARQVNDIRGDAGIYRNLSRKACFCNGKRDGNAVDRNLFL